MSMLVLCSYTTSDNKNENLQEKCAMQMVLLDKAIMKYKSQNGSFPAKLKDLVGLYLAGIPKDPWGNGYIYTVDNKKKIFELISMGADSKPGGTGFDMDLILSEIK